jgi:hypothetical protein
MTEADPPTDSEAAASMAVRKAAAGYGAAGKAAAGWAGRPSWRRRSRRGATALATAEADSAVGLKVAGSEVAGSAAAAGRRTGRWRPSAMTAMARAPDGAARRHAQPCTPSAGKQHPRRGSGRTRLVRGAPAAESSTTPAPRAVVGDAHWAASGAPRGGTVDACATCGATPRRGERRGGGQRRGCAGRARTERAASLSAQARAPARRTQQATPATCACGQRREPRRQQLSRSAPRCARAAPAPAGRSCIAPRAAVHAHHRQAVSKARQRRDAPWAWRACSGVGDDAVPLVLDVPRRARRGQR